jgi:3-oxo-5-alpha-steroid 4-dehydrogenase 1
MAWYTGNTLYDILLIVGFIVAILIYLGSKYGTAKYGGRW